MKRTLTLLLLILICTGSYAQRTKRQQPEPVAELPVKSFAEQLRDDYTAFYQNGGIFEKLYLQTDKPYYSAGETLYFSGFLVHATLLTRISSTAFVYAELISPEGQLIERIKICATNKQFIGTFSLSPRLTSGRYTLRAYTRWMTNFDMGYFFTKEIYIGNQIDDAISTTVTYQTNDNGTVSAFVRFSDQNALPIVSTPVKYRTIVDNHTRSGSARTDKNGSIEIRFRPSEQVNDCLELKIRANSRELSRFIPMPSFSDDFDVQFCPEGGNLIGNIVQIVAFKAVGTNGKGRNVHGKIFDAANGALITEIASTHNGMGRFVICTEKGHSYYAEMTVENGPTKRFDMPKVEDSGIAMRVMRHGDEHIFTTAATPDVDLRDYAAVVHSRGTVMTIIEDLSRLSRLQNHAMFDGIAQISVVNRVTRRVVAERLFYVRDNRLAEAQITPHKRIYEQRDKVVLTLDVKDSEGKPVAGNFALSVTDGSYVKLDEKSPNILSYMLLSSDLKGEVENAGQYFVDSSAQTLGNLDLVMMTNGWRRYELQSVIDRVFPRIMYPIEDSQRIRGSVFGLLGRARKPSVVVMDPKTKYVQSFELNEHNNFIISGLDAFSTTTYIVQALNKKGKDTTVRIKIESENYPLIATANRRDHYKNIISFVPEQFLTRAKERYFNEGGERIIDIEEVVVVSRKSSTPFFATGNTGSMLHGDLSRFARVSDALATFKELNVLGGNITTRKEYIVRNSSSHYISDFMASNAVEEGTSEGEAVESISTSAEHDNDMLEPDFYVNGNLVDIMNVDSYDTKYVERLAFVDGRAATMLGLSAPSGAILMEVSKEGLYTSVTSDAMARVVVRACQQPAEFYKQKYLTYDDRLSTVADLRLTIAWEPLVRTDATGRATVEFYTADRSSSYDIVLEGITDDGELCRHTSSIEVKYKPLS